MKIMNVININWLWQRGYVEGGSKYVNLIEINKLIKIHILDDSVI